MEWVPQVVDKAEVEHQEAAVEGYLKVGRRKADEGGRKQVKKAGFQCSSL